MPSLEEASRCPKCEEPGRQGPANAVPHRRGVKVIVFTCMNEACKWFNTGWSVQVNPDGTIPEFKPGPKQFPKLSRDAERFARDSIRQNEHDLDRGEIPRGW